MLQILGLKHGQGRGRANAVICAQGRASGRDPLALYVGVNGICGEVEIEIAVFLRYHVQMALQTHGFAVFKAWRGRLPDHHIACVIHGCVQSQIRAKLPDEGNDCCLLLGGAGDLGQTIEVSPNALGFELLDIFTHIESFLPYSKAQRGILFGANLKRLVHVRQSPARATHHSQQQEHVSRP